MAVPLKGEEGIIGIIGGVFNAGSVFRQVDNRRFGQAGYAYMIDKTGMIMAHPDKNKIMLNVTNSGSESLDQASRIMLQNQKGGPW